MARDDSPEATLARVDAVCQTIYTGLQRGLRTADYLHAVAGWSPNADIHLHRQMTRRDAMEELKQLEPELEDDDSLGLAMSGLVQRLPEDTIRIWHTSEEFIPVPDSRRARKFVCQLPERPLMLVQDGLGFEEPQEPEPNHLILQWTAQGATILRFALVRPAGYVNGRVMIDWHESLLGRYAAMEDLSFRRRDEGHGDAGEASDQ